MCMTGGEEVVEEVSHPLGSDGAELVLVGLEVSFLSTSSTD